MAPFDIIGPDRPGPFLVICDHASNEVPPEIGGGSLGLSEAEMGRHIAYDIGARGLAEALAAHLNAPCVASRFSRLVIDPNRGDRDPTLVMQLYDGTIIPANRGIEDAEVARRLAAYSAPYHGAIRNEAARIGDPVVVSIHSFTPQLKGRSPRPWQIGLLAASDRRLHHALLRSLQQEADLVVGDNVPYVGYLPGDSIDRHGTAHGRLNTLIELRNDLIADAEGQRGWAARLAPHLEQARRDAISAQKEAQHGSV